MEHVIYADQLCKKFGSYVAVDQVSFQVAKGEIFGIAGPNGAGKTTTMKMLMGLLAPDQGHVSILGKDPRQNGPALREKLGIQLQHAELPERMRVAEALNLFASFYPSPVDPRKLMDDWGLKDKAKDYFSKLSGGEKQRLFIALALINDPEIVFLDELTTGLDPAARRQTWELVRAIKNRGKTVIQVTHFMEEAEQLCDRVAIFNRGKLVALDSPQALIASQPNNHKIRFKTKIQLNLKPFHDIPEVSHITIEGNDTVIQGRGSLLLKVSAELSRQGLDPEGFRSQRACLEDVFLQLTSNNEEV